MLYLSRRTLAIVLAVLVAVAYVSSGQGWPTASPMVQESEQESRPALAPGTEMPIFYAFTKEPLVGLTFDISWGDKVVGPILDVLKQYGVHATFFLSGFWAKEHPDIVHRIVAEGHEIASHGDEHVNLNELSRAQITDNIRTADADLREASGTQPHWLRPPNGAYNELTLAVARQLGYETVIWSVDSLDWKRPGAEFIKQRVTSLVFPGAVVLFHASDSAPDTPVALPQVLAQLKAKGSKVTTLCQVVSQAEPAPDDPRGRPDYPPND